MAKTKMFDIPNKGLDSIECVKISSGFKVLTYASSENEKNKAITAAYKLNE